MELHKILIINIKLLLRLLIKVINVIELLDYGLFYQLLLMLYRIEKEKLFMNQNFIQFALIFYQILHVSERHLTDVLYSLQYFILGKSFSINSKIYYILTRHKFPITSATPYPFFAIESITLS